LSPDPTPPPLVKICGLTDPAEALSCVEAGAHWVGLNFHPPSPRFVTDDAARAVLSALPDPAARAVGLFVDRAPGFIQDTCDRLGLRVVQLHGDEPDSIIADLQRDGLTVIRAVRIGSTADLERLAAMLDRAAPDAVLVDAFVPGQAGGTGKTIAMDLLERLPPLPRLVLAGGLDAANVAGLVARVRPWMVDVASGVESSPGRKDLARVAAFITAAVGGAEAALPKTA
jgi:phosphoribosylanthranilate isomerase